MKKKTNLIVKLTAILMAASITVCMLGCEEGEENYDDFVVTTEHGTQVLHKSKKLATWSFKNYCGTEAIINAGYELMPQDYAYDVKCNHCFPEQ